MSDQGKEQEYGRARRPADSEENRGGTIGRTARERLRAEREQQARRSRLRRRLGVGAMAVAVLAATAGAGVLLSRGNGGGRGDGSDWAAAAEVAEEGGGSGPYARYAAPAHTRGEGGTDIILGRADAEHTLTLYEDLRCPVCAAFEQANGERIREDAEAGRYRTEYVFGTFLDERADGTGSRNALSALGAALDVSPEAFLAYKEVLFSADRHPDEASDEFADDRHLVGLAQEVAELRGHDGFERAVLNGVYDPWALRVSAKFDAAEDVTGTPAAELDGERIQERGAGVPPMDPERFGRLVEAAMERSAGR
ncbi:thioredoxin domain-containing protein [Streptomyces chitinivorans]|uniref:Thioredoxin domain-containing protein n=1 Tax=Streptomyces chitinivorans TaxID=1257027 RepID=A0ABW7HYY3_9ACTN|nr:thioredoxin domain-containing protein [Streptomyces chitinivorans]MDH2411600.1 thioredoxin domain-containing protein [Streptomyces chitinivorans]